MVVNLKVTEELAEFLGIMVGDGNIYCEAEKGTYRFVITGHSENDAEYLIKHVTNLLIHLFGKRPGIWKYKKKKSIAISICSKEIIEFLITIGIPSGRKSQTIIIPKLIVKNPDFKIKSGFLRGLADTEFSVLFHKGSSRKNHTYPIIVGTTSSRNLAYQTQELLCGFQIKANIYTRRRYGTFSKGTPQYELHIYGKKNLEKWMQKIGFNNENHLSKIKIWQKLGFYLPNTNLKERFLILNNNILTPRYMIASSHLTGKGRLD